MRKLSRNLSRALAAGLAAVTLCTAAPAATGQGLPDVRIPSSSELKLPEIKLPELPGSSTSKPATKAPAPRVNNAKPAPFILNGREAWVTTSSSGRTRRYLVVMPTRYNPARPAPILMGFHGWADPISNFRRYSRLHETGAAREAIRVYPEAINLGWEGAPYSPARPGEDLKFLQQIINELDRTYNVDRSRVYATGHSNGGGMTAVVACHLPHVFAGVASVGGAFYEPVNLRCSKKPMSFLIMHGVGDTMMRYHGGYRHGTRYWAVPDLMGSYIRRNGCAYPPRIVNIPGGQRHIYKCARKELQLITNPQDHTWNRVPDATQEVWNFLKRQRL